MIDDVGDFAVRVLQARAQVEQRLFVDEVEREVVELRRLGNRHAGRLRVESGSTSRYSKNASVEFVPKSKK